MQLVCYVARATTCTRTVQDAGMAVKRVDVDNVAKQSHGDIGVECDRAERLGAIFRALHLLREWPWSMTRTLFGGRGPTRATRRIQPIGTAGARSQHEL